MSSYLDSLSQGLARFVSAWLLPSAIMIGMFWFVCIPALAQNNLLPKITGAPGCSGDPCAVGRSALSALGLAAFLTIVLATILAYYSQSIYRFLEGYRLPRSVDLALTRRQLRRRERLALVSELPLGGQVAGKATEALSLYPALVAETMPTMLGNALKAMETYGSQVYGLDSQQFWFELIGTANDQVRREVEEARAVVDIFLASIASSALLAVVASLVALTTGSLAALALAFGAILVIPLAYKGAVTKMKDWSNSVRAMVNLGRHRLAAEAGLDIPWTLADEKDMWTFVSRKLHFFSDDPDDGKWLDVFRKNSRRELVAGELLWRPAPGEPAPLKPPGKQKKPKVN